MMGNRWLSGIVVLSMLFLSVNHGSWADPIQGNETKVLPPAGGAGGTGPDPAAAQASQNSKIQGAVSAAQAAINNNPTALPAVAATVQAPAPPPPPQTPPAPPPPVTVTPPAANTDPDEARKAMMATVKPFVVYWLSQCPALQGLTGLTKTIAISGAAAQIATTMTNLFQNNGVTSVAVSSAKPGGAMTLAFTINQLGVSVPVVITITTSMITDPNGQPIMDAGKPTPNTLVSANGQSIYPGGQATGTVGQAQTQAITAAITVAVAAAVKAKLLGALGIGTGP